MTLQKEFNAKTVLITGHSGFKGSWLTAWLKQMGAKVVGIALDPPTEPSHFVAAKLADGIVDLRIDIRDQVALRKSIISAQPDFVFHLAAQALVRPSYENPLQTLETNAMGSAYILDALRQLDKPVVAVMITSDKAYDNMEWIWGYRETDRLGGKDPYSASKGMAELAIRTFVESYFNAPESNVRVGITRAGNVIGGGDWAVDRIVPDCMRAWSKGETVKIRSPLATRPWQHVLEPLRGYLTLGAKLSKNNELHGEAYNFGPPAHQNHTVRELINEMSNHWDSVRWDDASHSQGHLNEAKLLKLNCDKALFDLHWQPALKFKDTVRMTVDWYRSYYQNCTQSMHKFTMFQVEEYIDLIGEHKIRG